MEKAREGREKCKPAAIHRAFVGLLGILILGTGIFWMIVCDPFSQALEAVR